MSMGADYMLNSPEDSEVLSQLKQQLCSKERAKLSDSQGQQNKHGFFGTPGDGFVHSDQREAPAKVKQLWCDSQRGHKDYLWVKGSNDTITWKWGYAFYPIII